MRKQISFLPVNLWLLGILLVGLVESVKSQADEPPLSRGLSWTFYSKSCPSFESIVKQRIDFFLGKDVTQAAGLLRLHFHDCFVQGCDASVLLDGSASGPSEQDAPPNFTLRNQAFKIINDIKKNVDAVCPRKVSCADITALATRDAVVKVGGPSYRVPLGRRDGLKFATRDATLANLPGPGSNVAGLLGAFGSKSLDETDLVALSGAHTIGAAHCSSFSNRLYPKQDPRLENRFAQSLYRTCPTDDSNNITVLDVRSPNLFDNQYYVDLLQSQGLFTSDQTLFLDDPRTKKIVQSFASNQGLFFQKFGRAMIKMGQLSVLTGNQGEIRNNCSAPNPTRYSITLGSVVDDSHISLDEGFTAM